MQPRVLVPLALIVIVAVLAGLASMMRTSTEPPPEPAAAAARNGPGRAPAPVAVRNAKAPAPIPEADAPGEEVVDDLFSGDGLDWSVLDDIPAQPARDRPEDLGPPPERILAPAIGAGASSSNIPSEEDLAAALEDQLSIADELGAELNWSEEELEGIRALLVDASERHVEDLLDAREGKVMPREERYASIEDETNAIVELIGEEGAARLSAALRHGR